MEIDAFAAALDDFSSTLQQDEANLVAAVDVALTYYAELHHAPLHILLAHVEEVRLWLKRRQQR